MAIDIQLIKPSTPIKNGSVVVTCSAKGVYSVMDDDSIPTPIIDQIESKYDDRFDDPSYYYGGGGMDGGTYTGGGDVDGGDL